MFPVGGYDICAAVTDEFHLDGGAMFGVVPKTLWGKQVASDALNRIELVCRSLIIRGGGRCVLIDLGCGDDWDEKAREIYGFKRLLPCPLRQVLPDVTDVIITHLHFDHVGGASYADAAGEP